MGSSAATTESGRVLAYARARAFHQTHLSLLTVGILSFVCFGMDTAQSIIEKYPFARKWFHLYAVLCLFVYMYMLPYIRAGLGPAARGYINYRTVYIIWLCSAVFYHLPSLEALGFDVKADLSLMLVLFFSTLLISGIYRSLMAVLVYCHILPMFALPYRVLSSGFWSLLILNSANITLSCTVLHSYCVGQRPPGSSMWGSIMPEGGGSMHSAVCGTLLGPILSTDYPKFAAWMTYAPLSNSSLLLYAESIPKLTPHPELKAIHPILTMWITCFSLYLLTGLADYASISCIQAHLSEVRAGGKGRGDSASSWTASHRVGSKMRDAGERSLSCSKLQGAGHSASRLDRAVNSVSRSRAKGQRFGTLDVKRTINKPTGGGGATTTTPHGDVSWTDTVEVLSTILGPEAMHKLVGHTSAMVYRVDAASGGMLSTAARISAPATRSVLAVARRASLMGRDFKGLVGEEGISVQRPQPEFQDMVPWYTVSLFKTVFDLMISLNLFMGRFDTRTMQAATGASTADSLNNHPEDGDGFTYEHLDDREELWLDFMADTGDGGDPTYTIAQALAAPQLQVQLDPAVQAAFPSASSLSLAAGQLPIKLDPSIQAAFPSAPPQALTHLSRSSPNLLQTSIDASTSTPPLPNSFSPAPHVLPPTRPSNFPLASNGTAPSASANPLARSNGHDLKSIALHVSCESSVVSAVVPDGDADPAPKATREATAGAWRTKSVPPPMGSIKRVPPKTLDLPRGELLLVGGDLAYPNPTKDTYEQRLFRPFQDAFPAPPYYHPGRLVVHKPDLPPAASLSDDLPGMSPRDSRYGSSTALRRYKGPSCFAIPGNHDHIDGLETFTSHIMGRGWLGGWLLPQEKSYFSLKLPHGWWIFGLDLALVEDIDTCQYRYFAKVVEQRMRPTDQVVIMTHQPIWLLDWYWLRDSSPRLRQLVRGNLRGRCRVHLAGDLHFYMRHSRGTTQPPTPPSPSHKGDCTGAAAGAPGATASAGCTTANAASAAAGAAGVAAGATANAGSATANAARAAAGATASVGSTTANAASAGGGGDFPTRPVPSHATHHARASSAPSAAQQRAPGGEGFVDNGRGTGADQSAVSGATGTAVRTAANAVNASASAAGNALDASASTTAGATGSAAGATANEASATPGSAGTAVGATASAASSGVDSFIRSCAADVASSAGVVSSTTDCDPEAATGTTTSALGVDSFFRSGAAEVAVGVVSTGTTGATGTTGTTGTTNATGVTDATVATDGVTDCATGPTTASTGGTTAYQTRRLSIPGSSVAGGSSDDGGSEQGARKCASFKNRKRGGGGYKAYDALAFDLASLPYLGQPASFSSSLPSISVRTKSVQRETPLVCASCKRKQRRGHLYDPDHLICNGGGGAFLHPTHIFSSATFTSTPDSAAEATAELYGGQCTCRLDVPPNSKAAPPTGWGPADSIEPDKDVYTCRSSYPTPAHSLRLGRNNLHLFRSNNTKFDAIGGLFYFLLVVSAMPRCTHVAAILDAGTVSGTTVAALLASLDVLQVIVLESYVSLAALVLLTIGGVGFAKGGGVGRESSTEEPAVHEGPPSSDEGSKGRSTQYPKPCVPFASWAKSGGAVSTVLYGVAHAFTHLGAAIVLLLLLELGVEVCNRYGHLGTDGPNSLYRWYLEYEARTFPDPKGLRSALTAWSLGLYPGCVKAVFTLFDIPEAIAVTRTQICASGWAGVPRMQAIMYYLGMLSYYWLLAVPVVAFAFGFYLYTSVCWFGVHADEAFSSLRVANLKSFTRLHINKDGDLEIYTLAVDEVPQQWKEDPKWRSCLGGGHPSTPAHEAAYPSRWVPDSAGSAGKDQKGGPHFRLIDYVKVTSNDKQP